MMKADCRLLALFILLASVGTTACEDSSGSITCGITEAICQNANKTLDLENCVCVRKKTAPACSLTEEICRLENKTLNAETCVCVSKTPDPACSLTEEICRSENKTLDEVNCVCLELLPEPLICKEYEHVYGSGCEVDTTENCGSHGYNCSEAVYGWKSGTCTDGQCLVTECNDRLYLKEEGICTESLSHDDHIIFGHYEQDGDTANGKEPAEATPYALKKGVFTNINGAAAVAASQSGICPDTHCYAYWWLRSPGLFKYLRTVVWADGNVLEDGYIVEDEKVGVRPAMWIWLR